MSDVPPRSFFRGRNALGPANIPTGAIIAADGAQRETSRARGAAQLRNCSNIDRVKKMSAQQNCPTHTKVTDGALLGGLKYGRLIQWDADIDLQIHPDDFERIPTLEPRIKQDGFFLRKHQTSQTQYLLQANEKNYLLIELNKRIYDPFTETPLYFFLEGKRMPIPDRPIQNVTQWYGQGFLTNRIRHVPEWEESVNPLFCGTPFHHNCIQHVGPAGLL